MICHTLCAIIIGCRQRVNPNKRRLVDGVLSNSIAVIMTAYKLNCKYWVCYICFWTNRCNKFILSNDDEVTIRRNWLTVEVSHIGYQIVFSCSTDPCKQTRNSKEFYPGLRLHMMSLRQSPFSERGILQKDYGYCCLHAWLRFPIVLPAFQVHDVIYQRHGNGNTQPGHRRTATCSGLLQ